MQDFSRFGLSDGTRDAIAAKGYETPSPIQAQAIPPLLEGRDLIGQAQTGTGKTAGFGIPLVEKHREDRTPGPVALILTPTRELAIQVTEEIEELAKGTRLALVPVYGGVGFGKQLDALGRRGSQVIVATPGRLLDLIGRGDIHLDKVRTLVLDEADRMLDMGFVRDVERIMREVPDDRQTMLFSATMPDAIIRLSKKYLDRPVRVEVEAETVTADKVDQYHYSVERSEKREALLDLLHTHTPERAVVFTRTKHLAKRLSDQLRKRGWSAVALQGNMTQGQRERALGAFRDGTARLLIATDVAARGLDVPEISHVVNYDVPDDLDAYVHRIGRTARMGRKGMAVTFVQPDQKSELRDIERTAGTRLVRFEMPRAAGGGQAGPDGDRVAKLVAAPSPQGNGGARRSGGGGRPGQGRSGGARRGGRGGGAGGRGRSGGGGRGGGARQGRRPSRPRRTG